MDRFNWHAGVTLHGLVREPVLNGDEAFHSSDEQAQHTCCHWGSGWIEGCMTPLAPLHQGHPLRGSHTGAQSTGCHTLAFCLLDQPGLCQVQVWGTADCPLEVQGSTERHSPRPQSQALRTPATIRKCIIVRGECQLYPRVPAHHVSDLMF